MPKPSRIEAQYQDVVRGLGCLVCRRLGHGPTPAEVHHLRAFAGAGERAPHTLVIPLCHAHHTSGGPGVAFHAGPRAWESLYGSETELLAITIMDAYLASREPA